MSTEAVIPSPELLAIAFVVESSLAVLAEWDRIVIDYIAQMLKRLSDANPGYSLHMAFVTYATADTDPSPLLCKQYFAEYQLVTKDIKDKPQNLGLGATGSSGNKGMAALEGLVAAVELFDILKTSSQPSRPHLNYIIHIAANAPDSSLNPQWNDSPSFDNTSWDELPVELKKRSIHMNSILLRQNIPRFSELHSAVASGALKNSWLNLRGSHSVLLSGFPTSAQKPIKRTGDNNNVEKTPESKRPRLVSQTTIDKSPKIQAPAPNTPSVQPKAPPAAVLTQPQPQPLPQAQPQTQVPQTSQVASQPQQPQTHGPPVLPQNMPSAAYYKAFVDSFRTIKEQVTNLQTSIQEAQKAGNLTLVENLKQEWIKKTALHQKFKDAITMYNQKAQAAQTQAQAHQSGLNIKNNLNSVPNSSLTHNSALHPTTDSMATSSGSQVSPNINAPSQLSDSNRSDSQVFAQMVQNRTLSSSGRMATPNGINTQMQKLIEDQQRRAGPGIGQSTATALGHVNMNPNQNMHTIGGTDRSSASVNTPARNQGTTIWHGSLSWSSHDSKNEISTYVVASTPNAKDSHVETWPKNMTLVPVRDLTITIQELPEWTKRHRAIVCTLNPQPHNPQSAQVNEQNYRIILKSLNPQQPYATAAWVRPSGEQGNNVLFFTIPNVGLVGAFFPLTGVPEIPKPQAFTGLLSSDFLRKIPPEQREAVFTQLKRYREQELQMQQARMNSGAMNLNNPNFNVPNLTSGQPSQVMPQQDPSSVGSNINTGANPFGGVPGSMTGTYGAVNMMNNVGMSQPQASSSTAGSGMQRSISGGAMMINGLPANLSYEMLQALMQHNQEGGVGGPV